MEKEILKDCEEEEEMEFKDCGEIEIGDETELSKIVIMRARVEKEDPSAKEVDDLTIRRFLRARNLDIDKASAMFLKYLSWRKAFVPKGYISKSEISTQLSHNKVAMQGVGKLGQPVAVIFGNRHKPGGKGSLEELKRFAVYSFDKVCASIPRGQEKFLVIVDLEGWGYTNSDIRGYISILSILQNYFPERLGRLYMIHVPSIFMTAWKVVYRIIDSRTRNKIIFVDNNKLKSTLLADIEESQLPDIYGGKLSVVPIQHSKLVAQVSS